MSHETKLPTAIKTLFLGGFLLLSQCARLGEAGVTLSEQNMLPAQLVVTGETKPGMGSNGGPITWDFWVKDRKATSDAMLGSFLPFYKLNAIRLAVSAHFVFYRDSSDVTINAGQAATVLATMETAYNNLKSIYGSGEHPYTNDGARIVILAYNIQDDYSTTGNYVGGYFSPRDLYSNQFTKALFTEPVAIQQYSNLVGILGGYSNEMSIINYDLNPGYSTNAAQVNDIVIHEISHLFTYSRRVIKQRVTNHDLWIAEGIAENAPHQTIQTSDVQQLRLTQLASPSTIDYFQDAPQLTDFQKWAPKIVGYLQSNLFFNYLRHRAELQLAGSSATMLSELMTRLDSTIESIDFLIQKYIPGATFASLYGDYVITHYLMMLGSEIQNNGIDGTGGVLNQKYSFCKSEIGISGVLNNCTSIKSRYSAVIPFNYEAPKCADGSYGLNPNSYFIFRHRVTGDQVPLDTAGSNPVSGELPLKYVINPTTEIAMLAGVPATTTLRTFDSSQTLPFVTAMPAGLGLTGSDIVHVLVYNPNKTGSCRPVDNALVLKRNHSKWVGSNAFGTQATPDFDWQTDTGAVWVNNQNGAYNRPKGLAVFNGGRPPTTPYSATNFIYVTDYNNMSLQKVDLDKGSPMGRLGRITTTCPTADLGWDNSSQRYQNGYCAHNLDSPQGVYVYPPVSGTANHEIYVADSSNRRIVKYDQSGAFQGWLGLNGTCSAGTWSTAATVTDAETLRLAGAELDPCMFWVPTALTSDGANLYILDSGKHRLLKRDRVTGNYLGYVGNGQNGWSASTANIMVGTLSGFQAGYFDAPSGIIVDSTYIYIADTTNQRVVRLNKGTGVFDAWMGNGTDGWKTSWIALSSGTGPRAFNSPSALALDATYIYIADQLNNRIVRWSIAGNTFEGWLGHGRIGWDKNSSAPTADPYAGVSYYPPDYYARPHGLAVARAIDKDTKRNYLYMTSVYNGRVTRINLDCAAAPGSAACDQVYDPFVQP